MRKIRRAAWMVAGGGALLWTGCTAYSGVVNARWRAWEGRVSRHPDGVRVGCEPYGLGEGRSAVLLVHGFGDNPSIWHPMAERLAAGGLHCRAMRLPGFGGTMAERRSVNLGVWSRALADEVAALDASHDEVWIVAHSLGATLAVRHVLNGGDEVAGLVLLAPLVEVSGRRSPLLGARAWFEVLGRFVPLAESVFGEDVRRELPAGRPAVERFIPVNVFRALFQATDEIAGQAGELRVPLYAALSPHDRVADSAAARAWLLGTSKVPRRRVVWARESAHLIPLDHDAAWVGDEVLAFIRDGMGHGAK
jgi:carboxylesterase